MMQVIKLADNKFSLSGGGEVPPDRLDIIIVDAAGMAREYWEGERMCWSSDTQRPDPDVPDNQRQCGRCLDCPKNIRGSFGRDCRFCQRLAVLVRGHADVFQLKLPPTSIFGKTIDGSLSLREYTRHLAANNTQVRDVITRVEFKADSYHRQVLRFKPLRPVTDKTRKLIEDLLDTEIVEKAKTHYNIHVESVTSSPFDSVDGYEHKPNHS